MSFNFIRRSCNYILAVESSPSLTGHCHNSSLARLYDYETHTVIPMKAWVRGFQTLTEAILQTGEHCKGESASGGGDAESWGNIYSHDDGSARKSLAAIPSSFVAKGASH